MSKRDQRAVLWLCCAAICWRWFVGLQAPLPGVEACRDLWLAERLAAGEFGALLDRLTEPLYGLLLAPALAFGADPFHAAQVASSLLGGLAIVPVALAAERLREGAGVPAAVFAMVAAGPVLAAGAGSAASMFVFLSACSLWAYAAGRWLLAATLFAIVVAGGADALESRGGGLWHELRIAVGAAVLALPMLLLPPRSKRFVVPVVAWLSLLAIAAATGNWLGLLPMHAALPCVLAGLAVARLGARWRELLLVVCVAIECHAAWSLGEPEEAVVERILPRFLQRHFHDEGQIVLSTMPRVLWGAGQNPLGPYRPLRELSAELSGPRAPRHVGSIVMDARQAADVSMRSLLASSFERASLPPNLQDLLDARGLHVLLRRR